MEEKKKEYLKLFDKIFETNTKKYIDVSKLPLLDVVYEIIRENVCMGSDRYKKLQKEQWDILDKLDKNWTQEEKKTFEEYLDLGCEMHMEMEQQNFMFGFIIAKELERESMLNKK